MTPAPGGEFPLPTDTSVGVAELAPTTAVLPVGSFEQHGSHLPLITDTLVATAIAQRVAAAYGLLCLPAVPISCSHEHAGFAGTVSLRTSTVISVIEDVAVSLAASGIDRLILVNGHGGNYVLSNVVQEANVAGPRMSLYPGKGDWLKARRDAGCKTNPSEDMHAGELEVSILLHTHPGLVRPGWEHSDWQADPRPDLLVTGMQGYTLSGVIGVPSLATPEKGEAILASLVRSFAAHLAALENGSR